MEFHSRSTVVCKKEAEVWKVFLHRRESEEKEL